jgi:hypothetical protein
VNYRSRDRRGNRRYAEATLLRGIARAKGDRTALSVLMLVVLDAEDPKRNSCTDECRHRRIRHQWSDPSAQPRARWIRPSTPSIIPTATPAYR